MAIAPAALLALAAVAAKRANDASDDAGATDAPVTQASVARQVFTPGEAFGRGLGVAASGLTGGAVSPEAAADIGAQLAAVPLTGPWIVDQNAAAARWVADVVTGAHEARPIEDFVSYVQNNALVQRIAGGGQ